MENQISLIREALKKKTWAVVGASKNVEKPSNKIVHMLLDYGYEVFCVNPTADNIDGLPAYPSVQAIGNWPEVADIVVPPKASLELVNTIEPAKVKYLWFQPGSFNEEVVSLARGKGFKVIADACVMVALKTMMHK